LTPHDALPESGPTDAQAPADSPTAQKLPDQKSPPTDEPLFEELERGTGRRVYRVRVAGERAKKLTGERLAELSKTVRLPGFRPGKIPEAVIESRYGAKARSEAIHRLAAEAAGIAMKRGELASTMELIGGKDSGDVEYRLAVTHMAELPPVDFEALKFERLSASASDLKSAGLAAEAARDLLDQQLREQVLDHLDGAYRFPLAPALVEKEYATIRQAAEEALAADSNPRASREAIAREAIASELRDIAERRVRLGAVVIEIARRNEIRVTPEDIESAKESGETPAQTSRHLMEDKVIAWLLSHATISEREASAEELRELVEAQG